MWIRGHNSTLVLHGSDNAAITQVFKILVPTAPTILLQMMILSMMNHRLSLRDVVEVEDEGLRHFYLRLVRILARLPPLLHRTSHVINDQIQWEAHPL